MSDQEVRDLAVKTIREEFSRRNIGVDRIVLFGSRVTGNPRPDSDWDFLIVTDKPVSREKRIDAQNAIIARCARSMIDIELVINDSETVRSQVNDIGAIIQTAIKSGVECD